MLRNDMCGENFQIRLNGPSPLDRTGSGTKAWVGQIIPGAELVLVL